jgi:hypothetical protein
VTQVEVDPDPTPTTTPWQEYLSAARSLDAVRREATAHVAAAGGSADAPAAAAQADLDRLRSRLLQQRATVTGAAVHARLPAPQLLPTASEQLEAQNLVPDSTTVPAALLRATALADAADAALHTPPAPERGWWPPPRWVQVTVLSLAAVVVTCLAVVLWLVLLWW